MDDDMTDCDCGSKAEIEREKKGIKEGRGRRDSVPVIRNGKDKANLNQPFVPSTPSPSSSQGTGRSVAISRVVLGFLGGT